MTLLFSINILDQKLQSDNGDGTNPVIADANAIYGSGTAHNLMERQCLARALRDSIAHWIISFFNIRMNSK